MSNFLETTTLKSDTLTQYTQARFCCGSLFTKVRAWKAHRNSIFCRKNRRCLQCSRIFATVHIKNSHSTNCHKNTELKCSDISNTQLPNEVHVSQETKRHGSTRVEAVEDIEEPETGRIGIPADKSGRHEDNVGHRLDIRIDSPESNNESSSTDNYPKNNLGDIMKETLQSLNAPTDSVQCNAKNQRFCCGKIYNTPFDWVFHQNSGLCIKDRICVECKLVFPDVWESNDHRTSFHVVKTPEPQDNNTRRRRKKLHNDRLNNPKRRRNTLATTRDPSATNVKNRDRNFFCIHCMQYFFSKDHANSAICVENRRCDVCNALFPNVQELELHRISRHSTKPQQLGVSSQTSEETGNERNDDVFPITPESQNAVCEVIGGSKVNRSPVKSSPEDLQGHRTEIKIEPQEAGLSDATTEESVIGKSKNQTISSAEFGRSSKEKYPICVRCMKAFRSAPDFKRHQNSNGCRKIKRCGKCHIVFDSVAILQRHLESSNCTIRKLQDGPCKKCNRAFCSKDDYTMRHKKGRKMGCCREGKSSGQMQKEGKKSILSEDYSKYTTPCTVRLVRLSKDDGRLTERDKLLLSKGVARMDVELDVTDNPAVMSVVKSLIPVATNIAGTLQGNLDPYDDLRTDLMTSEHSVEEDSMKENKTNRLALDRIHDDASFLGSAIDLIRPVEDHSTIKIEMDEINVAFEDDLVENKDYSKDTTRCSVRLIRLSKDDGRLTERDKLLLSQGVDRMDVELDSTDGSAMMSVVEQRSPGDLDVWSLITSKVSVEEPLSIQDATRMDVEIDTTDDLDTMSVVKSEIPQSVQMENDDDSILVSQTTSEVSVEKRLDSRTNLEPSADSAMEIKRDPQEFDELLKEESFLSIDLGFAPAAKSKDSLQEPPFIEIKHDEDLILESKLNMEKHESVDISLEPKHSSPQHDSDFENTEFFIASPASFDDPAPRQLSSPEQSSLNDKLTYKCDFCHCYYENIDSLGLHLKTHGIFVHDIGLRSSSVVKSDTNYSYSSLSEAPSNSISNDKNSSKSFDKGISDSVAVSNTLSNQVSGFSSSPIASDTFNTTRPELFRVPDTCSSSIFTNNISSDISGDPIKSSSSNYIQSIGSKFSSPSDIRYISDISNYGTSSEVSGVPINPDPVRTKSNAFVTHPASPNFDYKLSCAPNSIQNVDPKHSHTTRPITNIASTSSNGAKKRYVHKPLPACNILKANLSVPVSTNPNSPTNLNGFRIVESVNKVGILDTAHMKHGDFNHRPDYRSSKKMCKGSTKSDASTKNDPKYFQTIKPMTSMISISPKSVVKSSVVTALLAKNILKDPNNSTSLTAPVCDPGPFKIVRTNPNAPTKSKVSTRCTNPKDSSYQSTTACQTDVVSIDSNFSDTIHNSNSNNSEITGNLITCNSTSVNNISDPKHSQRVLYNASTPITSINTEKRSKGYTDNKKFRTILEDLVNCASNDSAIPSTSEHGTSISQFSNNQVTNNPNISTCSSSSAKNRTDDSVKNSFMPIIQSLLNKTTDNTTKRLSSVSAKSRITEALFNFLSCVSEDPNNFVIPSPTLHKTPQFSNNIGNESVTCPSTSAHIGPNSDYSPDVVCIDSNLSTGTNPVQSSNSDFINTPTSIDSKVPQTSDTNSYASDSAVHKVSSATPADNGSYVPASIGYDPNTHLNSYRKKSERNNNMSVQSILEVLFDFTSKFSNVQNAHNAHNISTNFGTASVGISSHSPDVVCNIDSDSFFGETSAIQNSCSNHINSVISSNVGLITTFGTDPTASVGISSRSPDVVHNVNSDYSFGETSAIQNSCSNHRPINSVISSNVITTFGTDPTASVGISSRSPDVVHNVNSDYSFGETSAIQNSCSKDKNAMISSDLIVSNDTALPNNSPSIDSEHPQASNSNFGIHMGPSFTLTDIVSNDFSDVLKCTQCDLQFTKNFEFREHLRAHNLIQSKSAVCDSELDSESHACHPLFCERCNIQFKDNYTFRRHLWMHIVPTHKCGLCAKQFDNKNALKDHLTICVVRDSEFDSREDPKSQSDSHSVNHLFCERCNVQFKDNYEFRRHLWKHLYPLTCAVCELIFTDLSDLREHIMSKHFSSNGHGFKCTHCSAEVSSEGVLKRHLKSHDLTYKCDMCSAEVTSAVELLRHYRSHKPIYKCTQCSAEVSSEAELKRHLKSHRPTFNGNQSNAEVSSEAELKRHFEIHRSRPTYKCTQCRAVVSSEADLMIHRCAYKCFQCRAVVSSLAELNSHLKSHMPHFKCYQCSEEVRSWTEHVRHLKTHMPSFKCSQCSVKLSRFSGFLRHLRSHRPAFKCAQCSGLMSSEADFNRHLKVHEPIYKCNQCSAAVSSETELERHLNSHMPTFKCSKCIGLVSTEAQLKRHSISHMPIFKCDQCSATVKSEADYELHCKIHGSVFKCNLCSANVNSEIEHKLHLTRHMPTFKCRQCSAVVSSEDEHKRHLTSHGPSFKCNQCSAVVNSAADLEHHSKIHVPAYKCNQCSTVVSSYAELRSHFKSHITFNCSHCGAEVNSEANLKRHLKKHGPISYKCSQCNAVVSSEAEIQLHSKFHGSAYKRNQCSAELSSEGELLQLKSHKPTLFTCNTCSKSFASNASLRSHLWRHFMDILSAAK